MPCALSSRLLASVSCGVAGLPACGWVGLFPSALVLKKSVCRGDDVFDFRAGLCFQERQRIDQNPLIGLSSAACLSFAKAARAAMH